MAIRNDPFRQMDRMLEQMRRMMDERWAAVDDWSAGEGVPAFGESTFDANLSVERTDEGYVVLADIPGFEREEIDLRFDDGRLYISALHEVDDDDRFRSRRVEESVRIPDDVLVDDVEATYSNGVLEVVLPIDEAAEDSYHIDVR
ncbi:MAG: Hsp20/alpha crystallin family protein [Haloarculaceae archaeon]